jgi:1,3-beta-galactosyl-N-acetylhexosamine phosphorylase
MKKPSKKSFRQLAGSVTLPAEVGEEKMAIRLANRWGADAIRDSDGTNLSPEMLDMDLDVYSTICLVRADQTYPCKHWDQLPQKFLMSDPASADSTALTIDPLSGFYREKYCLDRKHDPKIYWEVIDRTTGELVDPAKWTFSPRTGKVTLKGIEPFHVYTVNFLVFQIWDTTSMYNHLTNHWTKPHVISVDPYHRECWDHLMKLFDDWLAEHSKTDVVRLTTLAYHFAVDSDSEAIDKFRDWTGYQDSISVQGLEDFAAEHGYRLRSEDFVDCGYYNAACRVPSRAYLDWMQFIHRFVVKFGRALADKVHAVGKKTAIFWGDHWIGVEPQSTDFQRMGIDIHIGAAEDGVALRRVSDAPGPQIKELRLYPYFFPDVFRSGGDPTGESRSNWIKIRRALMRKNIDRIGYGGYLSLAIRFPDFVEHVAELADEFRRFKTNAAGGESCKAPVKVAMLNAWGRWKAWINSFGAPQKFLVKRPDVIQVAGTNLLECLAGLPVDIDFLSFAEIHQNGVPKDVDVLINCGDAETAWSGGHWWANPKTIAAIRRFVHCGGGFIGCRGPSAFLHQGRYFQLADVLGVDKEVGPTLQSAPVMFSLRDKHFITDDEIGAFDFGTRESFVFNADPATQVLAANGLHVLLAAKEYGKGRSAFFAGLPYSLENSRLLLRAILWSAGKDKCLKRWFCSNPRTDCAYYPKTKKLVVVNNSERPQSTILFDGQGTSRCVRLKPFESRWL